MKTSTNSRRKQPKVAEPKKGPRLGVGKPEGPSATRNPPAGGGCEEWGCGMNHNETLVREPAKVKVKAAKRKKAGRLQVVRMEARIAPGIWQNHNETLVREPAEAKPVAAKPEKQDPPK